MKSEPDYYTILQVDPCADPEVIKAAYRRLAANHHPDVDPSPEATERMKLLNAAYEVLSDPLKRKEHDASRFHGQQQRIEKTSITQHHWWFLVISVGILLLLVRFNVKLFLIAVLVLLLLWLLMNWQRHRN